MRETPVRIGPYEILIELAAGGMATTFIAHKRGEAFFERLVVVKRIHPWLLKDPKSGDMLREEARLGASIQHPHVVHVEDVTVSDGEVCLVMPYVESLSLGGLLEGARRAGERMPPGVASRIMLDVLSGLHAAHEAKDLRGQALEIVHRDVSPNNILVGSDGQSRIIDFGIARAKSRLTQTQSGDMKGTIAYMSPEQLRRRELDRRADVFAAGAVFYEALAGERLFDGRDEADILIGVLADEIPSVHSRWPDLDSKIDGVLAQALARHTDERYSTARNFAEALEAALAPAPASDVAAWVHRFGDSQFIQRREAIRNAVERSTIEVSHSGVSSDTTPSGESNLNDRRKPTQWPMALGILAVLLVFMIAARVSWSHWGQVPEAVENAGLSSSYLSPAQSALLIQQPAVSSKPDNRADAIPSALPASSMTAKPLPAAARRSGPIHEKVDKSRPTELQENPYR